MPPASVLSRCYACRVCCASCAFRSGASQSASGSRSTRSTRSARANCFTLMIQHPIFVFWCFFAMLAPVYSATHLHWFPIEGWLPKIQKGVLCVPRVLLVPFFVASGAAFGLVLCILRVPGVLRVSYSCLRCCLWGCLHVSCMFCMFYRFRATGCGRGSKMTQPWRVPPRWSWKKSRKRRQPRRRRRAVMLPV